MLLRLLVCDGWPGTTCDRAATLGGEPGETGHRLRYRAKRRGWRHVPTATNAPLGHDGPGDYCPHCAAELEKYRRRKRNTKEAKQ